MLRTMQLTERHVIKPSSSYYTMLSGFCRKSKDLYNQANYKLRQHYFITHEVIGYCTLDKLLKSEVQYPDYREMPTAQSAQQTLRLLSSGWNGFVNALKAYYKNPHKFKSRPKCPGYLARNGRFSLILTNQNCRLINGVIRFPKIFNGFSVRPEFVKRPDFRKFHQVRFIPKPSYLVMELVYSVAVPDKKPDNGRYIGIDIGVNNLACVANNFHEQSFMINGRPLKSMNQYYNKWHAKLKSDLDKQTDQHYSNKLRQLDCKRNHKVQDYMHKASRYVINWCIDHDVSRIIVGKNDGWKQQVHLGNQNNQNFVNIPFNQFIDMLLYKADLCGIDVILTSEACTSGTSAIDDEQPVMRNYNKSRRIYRGLFRSNNGILINADLNAAYQIMKKVVSFQWDRGCVLHPITVSV